MAIVTECEIVRDVGNDGRYEIVVIERASHFLSFVVYCVIGRTKDGTRIYNRDSYEFSPDPVEHRSLAQPVLSGSIKWDGCSDITIDDEPLHFCGRSGMEEFTAVLSAIYDLAAELIPSYGPVIPEASEPEKRSSTGLLSRVTFT